MRALVTGANGFVGRNLVVGLLAQGWEVRSLVRNSTRVTHSEILTSDVYFGDVRIKDSLKKACHGVDCVFHTAAKVSDWGRWYDFEANTVGGTANIAEYAHMSGVRNFVHISSVDVYDRDFVRNSSGKINEGAPLVNASDSYYYARSKMMAEKVVETYNSVMNISIVRPGTIFGPGDTTIMPRIVEFLRDPSACLIKGYDPILGLIYIDDLVDLCLRTSISRETGIMVVFNAVSDEEVRLRQFLTRVSEEIALSLPEYEIPYWLARVLVRLAETYAKVRNIEPLVTSATLDFLTLEQSFSISRAKEVLGWQPRIGFEEGIKRVFTKGGV